MRAPHPDPVPEADAYIYIDDGRDDLKWIPPHPNFYWAIDTHLGYAYRVWKAKHFDRVFTAQRDAVAQFKRDGIPWVEWLPLACHPQAHPCRRELLERGAKEEDLRQQWDIVFVGFLNDAKGPGMNSRVDYLDRLFREFPNSWLSVNCFFEPMAIRYIKGRLGFNISIRNDLNMRVFEVMSTGAALLTNRNVEGIESLFEEGTHYIGYESQDEMVEAARYALDMDGFTERVGASGFQEVRNRHTYLDRMRVIMEELRHVG